MQGRRGTETKDELKSKFLEHLKDEKGFTTYACDKTPISYMTYTTWLKADPEFKEQVDEIIKAGREKLTDIAEKSLLHNITKGKETSTIFYLKTQARHRGYVERQEITGKDGESLFSKESLIAIAKEIAKENDPNG